ncbi:hypothetical protein Afil01_25940 [Actinorhabdospora filicis]|uniref:DUF4037 domain-containing protein n=1 Tax=Actinorhabdospora filicis TaxID=1785913 RepID=A0A9W6SKV5_9ACTN|nr:hypothetical protein [Actinorhabdospora filicis]GLZ77787.1 hypothetical protein Afil01_25940 [Actinorhabdospora filicis]
MPPTRRAIVLPFAAAYASRPGAAAVLLTGSAGRGHDDRWSDAELAVLWAEPPSTADRELVASAADTHRLYPFDSADGASYDDLWRSGLLIEVVHTTLASAHAKLDALLERHEPDPGLLALASALAHGKTLAGDASELTGRVRDYPRPLAAAVARRLGQIDHFWRWRMYVERRCPHGLREHWSGVVTALTHALLAVNRVWWSGPKWAHRVHAALEIAPASFAERVLAVDAMSPPEAAGELARLVGEVHGLLERHLPEADPGRLAEIFAFGREPWPDSLIR